MGGAAVRTLEEIEAARAARRAGIEARKAEQLVRDMEALDAAEIEHGDDMVKPVHLNTWSPGLPTFVVVRMPTGIEFKRFQDMAKKQPNGKDGDAVKASNLLADVCVIYPSKEDYARVREACPGVHIVAGTTAADMSAARAEEAGKG